MYIEIGHTLANCTHNIISYLYRIGRVSLLRACSNHTSSHCFRLHTIYIPLTRFFIGLYDLTLISAQRIYIYIGRYYIFCSYGGGRGKCKTSHSDFNGYRWYRRARLDSTLTHAHNLYIYPALKDWRRIRSYKKKAIYNIYIYIYATMRSLYHLYIYI